MFSVSGLFILLFLRFFLLFGFLKFILQKEVVLCSASSDSKGSR